MKKVVLIVFLIAVICIPAAAQTGSEWVNQKSTQRKYLLQQIAALHIYIGYAKKGYDIVGKGVNTVHNIKNGYFNLHRDFFGSLNNINPQIKKYTKLADLLAYQYRIIKQTKESIKDIKQSGQFTASEIDYCQKVFSNLLDDCIKTIDNLVMVITSDKLQMKDDERIKRIDILYTDMQDKYAFCSSFTDEMAILSIQRLTEQQEINYSKKLNGLR